MVVATKLASSLLLLSLLGLNESFLIERNVIRVNPPRTSLFMIDSQFDAVPRRFLLQVAVGAMLPAVLVAGASPSRADVSDGNALPQGAQQFARVLKLKTDLKVCSFSRRGEGAALLAYLYLTLPLYHADDIGCREAFDNSCGRRD